jgi:hypothetical protein
MRAGELKGHLDAMLLAAATVSGVLEGGLLCPGPA